MKYYLLLIAFLPLNLLSQIQIHFVLEVNEKEMDLSSFIIDISDTELNYEVKDIEKMVQRGEYMNTNMFAFHNKIMSNKTYEISFKTITSKDTIEDVFNFYVNNNYLNVRLHCLLDTLSDGYTPHIRKLILLGLVEKQDSLEIKVDKIPNKNASPFFKVKNHFNDTVYNITHYNLSTLAPENRCGKMMKAYNNGGYSRFYYDICKAPNINYILPQKSELFYPCNKDCDILPLTDNGKYLFEMYFSKKDFNSLVTSDSKFETIEIYRMVSNYKKD